MIQLRANLCFLMGKKKIIYSTEMSTYDALVHFYYFCVLSDFINFIYFILLL